MPHGGLKTEHKACTRIETQQPKKKALYSFLRVERWSRTALFHARALAGELRGSVDDEASVSCNGGSSRSPLRAPTQSQNTFVRALRKELDDL